MWQDITKRETGAIYKIQIPVTHMLQLVSSGVNQLTSRSINTPWYMVVHLIVDVKDGILATCLNLTL